MFNREEAKRILDKVMEVSTADETEAAVESYESALTRYADNHIHQNVAESGAWLAVRAVLGKRMGEASTNKFDDASIEKAVADAMEIAKFVPDDPELLPRLEPQTYREVDAYDASVDALGPRERARGIADVISLCQKVDLKAAGAFSNGSDSGALANSKGLFAFHQSSHVSFSALVMSDDSSGWAEKTSHKASEINPKELGEIAIKKAELSRDPKEVDPGAYTVILEPEAAAGVIGFLASGFNALALDEGRSFLRGKVGEKIVGEGITLTSDAYHSLHQGEPFDGEGVPRKRVVLIERGVAKNLVYDRLTAKRHGVEPTGHGFGGRNAYGAYPSHLVMEGGETSVEEMVESTERGILVTRFHYQNIVDPMEVIVTGMTRDGTFWIEKGEIEYGIKNLRFNQSVLEMLSNVELMSPPVLISGMVVPALKVKKFNFTSGTEF